MTSTVPRAFGLPAARDHLWGCALVMLSGLLWSFGGMAVRLAPEADGWQYMVYRAAGQVAAMALWSLCRGRGSALAAFLRAGPPVWLAAGFAALSSMTYVFALKTTTVADVVLIGSTAPLWTAGVAALLLRERPRLATGVAILLGLAGIAVMEGGGVRVGHPFGNLMALGAALGLAGYSVCLRFGRARDWEPAVFGFGLMALLAALAGVAASREPVVTAPLGMLSGFLHGFVLNGVGSTLYVHGARHVRAAEMTVLAQTETIGGPFWVWLVLGEVPPPATLAGGALILAAVLAGAGAGGRRAPPPATQ